MSLTVRRLVRSRETRNQTMRIQLPSAQLSEHAKRAHRTVPDR
ncbi:hypothetical protein BLSMQ_3328 [Brevibacterium aurantiacum]|uniref:Uncharacterized protein n=1 Tax=Brevibacterium aurantiacum TaxID=273384 RepID=A0A1D7W8S8_BREAU|nr:hypothetical protein BLSMQ_3328 [Brevibacterium aurantiacum]